MPGNVANSVSSTVLPEGLCRAFAASLERLTDFNDYKNGESHRRKKVETSRRSWIMIRAVDAAQWDELVAFAEARKGVQAFFFYDPFEHATGQPVGSNYDPTGVSTQGRYKVRFDGVFSCSWNSPRGSVDVRLLELA